MELHASLDTTTLVSAWRDLLVQETTEIDQAGVNAAVVAFRLVETGESPSSDPGARIGRLVGRRVRSTDRLGATSASSFAMLLSPANALTETVDVVHSYSKVLADHRIPALTAFAFRRPAESLVDTWARAEAELDRAQYRSTHASGINL